MPLCYSSSGLCKCSFVLKRAFVEEKQKTNKKKNERANEQKKMVFWKNLLLLWFVPTIFLFGSSLKMKTVTRIRAYGYKYYIFFVIANATNVSSFQNKRFAIITFTCGYYFEFIYYYYFFFSLFTFPFISVLRFPCWGFVFHLCMTVCMRSLFINTICDKWKTRRNKHTQKR